MSKKSLFQEKNTKKLPGNYTYTSMVSHRGTVVSFGMNEEGKIKYAALDLSPGDGKSAIDRECWSDIRELAFPQELSQSGYGVVQNYRMPLRDEKNNILEDEDVKSKIDPFYSSTAKLSAKAPFQLVSDGQYIYLFRQALPGKDATVDKVGSNSKVSVVDSTLLVDRFILSGTVLLLSREIRYQRSRHKTQPASRKDSLSPMDMDKNPFYEPTRELGFVNNLSKGGFSVLLIPTQETEIKRWQIFYYDKQSKKVNSINIKSGSDGWLDTTDSEEFVDNFVNDRGLDSSFIDEILKQIRDGSTEDKIETSLKGNSEFKEKLKGLKDGEIAEVVFTVRTGIIKDDFTISGSYEVETGMSSIYYYQQETDPKSGKPMKNKASVMLAMGLKKQNDEKQYLGVLNFSVSTKGRLSRLSKENLQLPELNMASMDKEGLLEEIKKIEDSNVDIRKVIEERRKTYNDDIPAKKNELTGWSYSKAKRITMPMISPLLSKDECFKHTTNLTSVTAAIDKTNNRKAAYQTAINALNNSESSLKAQAVAAGKNSVKSKKVQANSTDFELKYKCNQTTNTKDRVMKRPLWASNTQGKPAWRTYMQNDGNFVVYERSGKAAWASGRYGSRYYGSRIVMQDDGNLVIYDRKWEPIWSSGTHQTSKPCELNAGHYLPVGGELFSQNQFYRLVYQGDGNLVIYNKSNRPLWASNTQGKPAWRTYMQNDGNFVVYKRRGAPVWASGRYGSQYYGSRIVMQNDGNLVIYDRYRRAIWASNTVQTPPSDSVYFSNKSVLNNNYFSAGQGLVSGNNLYRLIYQDDGNLLIYKGDLKLNGAWDHNSARSKNRSGRYACYYTFNIQNSTNVKISLESSVDTYLFLLKDESKIACDDDGGSGRNSLITKNNLSPGTYMIEATTYGSNTTGRFKLTVDGVTKLTEVSFKLSAERINDDRPTLRKLLNCELDPILPFYRDQIKPQLEQLNKNQIQLNEKQKNLKTGISSVKMPIIEIDGDGLTSSGGLLNFAYTADKPFLFDDSLGRVSLYFRGKNDNFFSAYFNPNIAQSIVSDSSEQSELSFKPRLTNDMQVELKTAINGNSCGLTIEDKKNQNKTVEKWDFLPLSSKRAAAILNGNGNFSLGYLSQDYLKSKGAEKSVLTIACLADNEFLPTRNLSGLAAENGIEKNISEFLSNNRILLVGNKRFEIVSGSKVIVNAGRLSRKSIAGIVTDDAHIETIWNLLKTKNIIKESDNSKIGIFVSNEVFSENADNTIKSILALPEAIKYTEKDLVGLIKRAASMRQISFQVDDINTQTVDFLNTGLDVQTMYDFSNYSCFPNNLTGISIDKWQHNRSFLFHAYSASDMNMQNFESKTYTIENAMGQWEAYDPGLAISFDRALEVKNGQGKVGLLTTNDTDKLAELQPTSKGLTMEAWIHPREISAGQGKSGIICYRSGKHNYGLSIKKDGSKYKCFAIIENKKLEVDSAHDFNCWKHLAATFKKYWGLKLDSTFVNCGNDMSLSLDGEFAIELLVKFDNDSSGTLFSKKDEYCVKVNNRKIAFTLGNTDVLADNKLNIKTGAFHKITVIKSKAKPRDITSSTDYPMTESQAGGTGDDKWYKNKSSDKIIKGMAEQQDKMMQNTQFAQSTMLGVTKQDQQDNDDKYYYSLIIGDKSYTSNQKDISPVETQWSNLHIGGADLKATFDEVRIWNRALSMDEAKESAIAENKNSLLSWWRVSEGEGKYLYDDAGQNHGVIDSSSKPEWVDSPNTDLPRFKFYIDGMQQNCHLTETSEITTENQFSIGGYKKGSQYKDHFDGILEEIRIWGVSRSAEEICDNAFGRLKGEREKLLANYTFDTNFSEIKKAALSDIDGITEIESEQIWAELLKVGIITVDGTLIKKESVLKTKLNSIAITHNKHAIVDKIIKVFKSPMEIKDLGYNSITLEVEGHIWSGDLGKENITQILSTAPISAEIPAVRSALSGVKTDYNDNISSCPAVVEYGDVQENDDGTINGILKKCYSFINKDGQWNLMTGYKVGNLVTEWYGQAQFDPQVMGFLEGSPPVPGENFPITKDSDIDIYAYKLDNSVEFEQAEEVSYNYATSKESGYQVTAESEASAGFALRWLIAPFGFGISQGASMRAEVRTNWETTGNRSQSFERGVSINTDRVLSASLAGYDNGKSGAERYYKLGNTGYALVKSKTADIYLLRLEHNNALVSICWRPNPDIPEDTNIISFPINPLYTKQGTLDGKLGDKCDDHYPLAQGAYGEYSYFKPREAYKLKRQIDKEKQAIENYYLNFKTSETTGRLKAAIAATGVQQLGNLVVGYGPVINSVLNQTLGQVATQVTYNDTKLKEQISKKMSQRNLVNTYVWTVEGGFYAESTEVAETQQEVYNNDYSLSLGGAGGISIEAEVGVKLKQEVLFGSGSSLTMTRSKTKEASKSFGLNVSVDIPTSPRYKYDGLTMRKGLISPGTVDAYRFMSFYLEPKAKNYVDLFTKIIDPKWLDESPDPNANALRQARNDAKKPFCWRIMHRVTFVSRILPEFEPEAAPSLEKLMRAKNIESNYMLIKFFEPYIGHMREPEEFLNKIDLIIDGKLPEFAEYKKEIKAYLELYYGIY